MYRQRTCCKDHNSNTNTHLSVSLNNPKETLSYSDSVESSTWKPSIEKQDTWEKRMCSRFQYFILKRGQRRSASSGSCPQPFHLLLVHLIHVYCQPIGHLIHLTGNQLLSSTYTVWRITCARINMKHILSECASRLSCTRINKKHILSECASRLSCTS